jgi:hypothetical protein
MANWDGTSRSNYFRVKEPAAFRAAIEAIGDVEVVERAVDEGAPFFAVMPSSMSDSGDWPDQRYNEETDDYEDIGFFGIVAGHLVEGEIAVFQTIGAEKRHYLTGVAVAVNHEGTTISVSLDDIYEKAANAFGIPQGDITLAQY